MATQFDGRILLPLSMSVGLAIWNGGTIGLSVHLVLAVAVAILICRAQVERRAMALVLLRFVLVWALLVCLAGLWQGLPWEMALERGFYLGARLAGLAGVGFCLAIAVSARSLGLALTWYLRPFLRNKAWQAGLALALLIHFLPLCLHVFVSLKQTMRIRPIHGGFLRKAKLLPLAGLRIMAQRTWKQAVAVNARSLDTPEAWDGSIPSPPLHWVLALLAAGASWSLALL